MYSDHNAFKPKDINYVLDSSAMLLDYERLNKILFLDTILPVFATFVHYFQAYLRSMVDAALYFGANKEMIYVEIPKYNYVS